MVAADCNLTRVSRVEMDAVSREVFALSVVFNVTSLLLEICCSTIARCGLDCHVHAQCTDGATQSCEPDRRQSVLAPPSPPSHHLDIAE